MSAFLDETGTLITVDHSNPLPVALVAGFTSLNDGELKTASYANPLPVTVVTTDYTEAELPDADDVAVGTEVFNTTYQVKVRSNGTSWMYLGIGTATLSALPLPTAVPSGTKFNITNLGTGSALFYSNGTYWLPVGEQLIAVDGAIATLTGTTNETVLATFAFPAKLASPKMVLSINSLWSNTNSSNNKTPRVRLGGISGTTYSNPVLTATAAYQTVTSIRSKNSVSSQVGMASPIAAVYSISGGNPVITSTIDMSASNTDIVITGQLADSSESLTLQAYSITLRG